MEINKQVYIPSLEANALYSHMVRDNHLKMDYCGMLPFSLELIKLKNTGLEVKHIKNRDKYISDDIINVKFKQKTRSGIELLPTIQESIVRLEIALKSLENEDKKPYIISNIAKLKRNIEEINSEKNTKKWEEVGNNELRRRLYKDGFTIRKIDKETGEILENRYKVYKRSSSKSRTGQCLFIKEALHEEMVKWSRMNLSFHEDMEVDLASLLAYESLVGSSLEDTIKIKPNNMLLIDDVESRFIRSCNVVKKGEDGYLDSFKENAEVINSLFDGASLLDSEFFEEECGMKLLRNHMFKSAAFNCNIQEFLKEHCPKDIEFEKWKVKDKFNRPVLAKNIKFIFTPTSLKALKFYKVLNNGTELDMWEYWKDLVKSEGSVFGVCKHEKQSKHGYDDQGNVLQQTSYQMVNSLPLSREDIKEIVRNDKETIVKLKEDDDFFIDSISKKINITNSNAMFSDLYKRNKNIVGVNIFREFRERETRSVVNHVKKGKIKIPGDYCVMLGNPIEYLYHAINLFDVDNLKIRSLDEITSLTKNEVYTRLYEDKKELIGFRNPHTSPSNVLIAKNKEIKFIDKYFNLTKNIICVNAIDFELQDILSGCDYDSDTLLVSDQNKLVELGKKCFGNYLVCLNQVESQKKPYKLNTYDMAEIDNQLSTSQKNIGRVVNLGQLCMSTYWDSMYKGKSKKVLDILLKKVDVMTVLSGISIDLAKKFYDINIDQEILNVSRIEEIESDKPLFWKYIRKKQKNGKVNKGRTRKQGYHCPMDFLYKEMKLDNASRKEDLNIIKLLIPKDTRNGNRKQLKKINNSISEIDSSIKYYNKNVSDEEERIRLIEDCILQYIKVISKLKIKEDTMYVLIKGVVEQKYTNATTRALNLVYSTHKEVFLNAFKFHS